MVSHRQTRQARGGYVRVGGGPSTNVPRILECLAGYSCIRDHIRGWFVSARRANPAADTSALEREIDRLVYALYGLTEEEIAVVEGR